MIAMIPAASRADTAAPIAIAAASALSASSGQTNMTVPASLTALARASSRSFPSANWAACCHDAIAIFAA